MAETRRASPARPSSARYRNGPRPVLPHPRYNPPPHLREEAPDLRPPIPAEEPAPTVHPRPAVANLPRPARPPAAPARSRAGRELIVLAVLVLGLALNALALLRHAMLSRADVLLGATVLLSGLALLVMMEVYRRTGR